MTTGIQSVKQVCPTKAGLKQVFIVTTTAGKAVFAQDTGKAHNWLSHNCIEPSAIRYVRKNGFHKTPRVIDAAKNESWQITTYEGIEDFVELRQRRDAYFELGRIQGQIHSLQTPPGYGGLRTKPRLEGTQETWTDTVLQILDQAAPFPGKQEFCQQITESEVQAQPCVSHGDYSPRNIRVDKDNNIKAVIDWQNCWVSDGLTPFLYRRMRLEQNVSEDNVQAYTEGYKSTCPQSVKELSPKQTTVAYFIAHARLYNEQPRTVTPFLQTYKNLDRKITLNQVL